MSISIHPVKSELKIPEFDLFEVLVNSLERAQIKLENADVLVISSKYVANSQGRTIEYENVISSAGPLVQLPCQASHGTSQE